MLPNPLKCCPIYISIQNEKMKKILYIKRATFYRSGKILTGRLTVVWGGLWLYRHDIMGGGHGLWCWVMRRPTTVFIARIHSK